MVVITIGLCAIALVVGISAGVGMGASEIPEEDAFPEECK